MHKNSVCSPLTHARAWVPGLAGRIMLHTRVYFSRMCYQIAPRVLHFSAFITDSSYSSQIGIHVTDNSMQLIFFFLPLSSTPFKCTQAPLQAKSIPKSVIGYTLGSLICSPHFHPSSTDLFENIIALLPTLAFNLHLLQYVCMYNIYKFLQAFL